MADYPATPLPIFPLEETKEYRTLINEAEGGSEQRVQVWSSPRRRFRLVYDAQSASTIWDFLNSYNGAADSFTFDPADFQPSQYTSENITVRLASDLVPRRFKHANYYTLTVELLEVK